MVRLAISTWIVCALLGLSACATQTAPAGPTTGLALTFAALTSAQCSASANGSGNVPKDVERLTVQWTADNAAAPGSTLSGRATIARESVDGTNTWNVLALPVTKKMNIEVYGCDKTGKVIYGGRTNDLAVEDQKETTARVFMTPMGKLACTGSGGSATMTAPRSLSGGAVLPRGDVVIVGGLGAWSSKKVIGTATGAVDIYDYRLGQFRKGPNLQAPRIAPHVHAISETQVLVVGGLTQIDYISTLAAQPSPLLAPDAYNDTTVPKLKAEVIDVSDNSVKASAAEVVVGALPQSSSIHRNNDILFVGGVDTSGAPVAAATRVGGLQDIAGGGKGTKVDVTLSAARARPALLAFADDSVVVWGGSKNATDMGEIIGPDGTKGTPLVVSGDTIIGHPGFTAVGSIAVVIGGSGDTLSFLVGGGALYSTAFADNTPSYVVTVDKVQLTAVCKPIALSQGTLRVGFGAAAVKLPTGQVAIAGGVLALKALPDICKNETECILDSFVILEMPTDLNAATVTFAVASSGKLGADAKGPHFGMLALPLPSGSLFVGGQTGILTGEDNDKVLDDVGEIVNLPPNADNQAVICAP